MCYVNNVVYCSKQLNNFISVLDTEPQNLDFVIGSAMRGNVSIMSSLEKVYILRNYVQKSFSLTYIGDTTTLS